jgi:hypothetical protein
MDKKQIEKLADNPKFIAGIYNYCDRWCQRCEFTQQCMTYALCENEFDDRQSRDIHNKVFWDKMHEIFRITLEMVKEKAQAIGVDLDDIDHEEIVRQIEQTEKVVKEQPYNRAALEYIKMADKWLDSNKELLKDKANELQTLAQADIPGTNPVDEAVNIKDCLEVICWYQHQIYIKLCRAASGTIRGSVNEIEYFPQDAKGSAKVAIIGIERSISAWGKLLNHFPQQQHTNLDLLVKLKKLLRNVETVFTDAQTFARPGFDIKVHRENGHE